MPQDLLRPAPPEGGEAPYPPSAYSWYVVAVLTIAYVFSFIDRQILNLLVGPIERDLGIGDTRMSLLMGFTFAVFYTLFGIPLGRLADSRSRRGLIATGVAAWSVMTAGCGVARGFWQLALFRMGVGVGEAALSPAAYSMIADSFHPRQRATAISVYSMGIYLGSGLAFLLGGLVVRFASGREAFDLPLVGPTRAWQLTFFVVGLPGLLVALLISTLREPMRRGRGHGGDAGPAGAVPLRVVWGYFRENRATLAYLNLGIAFLALSGYGATSWLPTLFVRKHGLSAGEAGVLLGLIIATAGTLGIVAGGRLADRLRHNGRDDAELRVALLAALACLPFGVAYPLVANINVAALLLAPTIFFGSVPFGVAPAALQRIMPGVMRAQATAVYLFVINLIGLGIGPTAVALLTDEYFRDKGAVGRSLSLLYAGSLLLALALLATGLAPYRRSLDTARQWNGARG